MKFRDGQPRAGGLVKPLETQTLLCYPEPESFILMGIAARLQESGYPSRPCIYIPLSKKGEGEKE